MRLNERNTLKGSVESTRLQRHAACCRLASLGPFSCCVNVLSIVVSHRTGCILCWGNARIAIMWRMRSCAYCAAEAAAPCKAVPAVSERSSDAADSVLPPLLRRPDAAAALCMIGAAAGGGPGVMAAAAADAAACACATSDGRPAACRKSEDGQHVDNTLCQLATHSTSILSLFTSPLPWHKRPVD
jgi:hypothetical protein